MRCAGHCLRTRRLLAPRHAALQLSYFLVICAILEGVLYVALSCFLAVRYGTGKAVRQGYSKVWEGAGRAARQVLAVGEGGGRPPCRTEPWCDLNGFGAPAVPAAAQRASR